MKYEEVLDIKARLARGDSVAQVAFDMKRASSTIYRVKHDKYNQLPIGRPHKFPLQRAAAKAKKDKAAALKMQKQKEIEAQKKIEAPPMPPRKRQRIEEHREVVVVMETYTVHYRSEEASAVFLIS